MSAPERIKAWPSFGPNSVTGEWSANTYYDERAEEYLLRNGETVATLIAQARAEAMKCPLGLDDDSYICSAASCLQCQVNRARAEALEDYAKAVEDRTVKFYPIVMPVKNGVGPADLGEEVLLTWEVWEAGTLNAISSHEYLSDAIAAAIRARKDEA